MSLRRRQKRVNRFAYLMSINARLARHLRHARAPRAFFLPLRNNDVRRSKLKPREGILQMILSTFEFVLIFRQ